MVPLGTTEPIWSGEGWTSTLATKGIEKTWKRQGVPTGGEISWSKQEGPAGRPRPFDLGQLTTLWLAGES